MQKQTKRSEEEKAGIAVVVLSSLSHGGAERVLINVANTWSKITTVYLITRDPEGVNSKTIDNNVIILTCRSTKLWLFDLLIHLRNIKPQYVLSSIWDINIILVIFRYLLPNNFKLIIRESVSPIAHLSSLKLGAIYLVLYRFFYKRCDLLIAPSQGVASEVKSILGRSDVNIIIIENYPNLERIKKVLPRGGSSPGKYIVSVGRLTKQKGYDLLINAFKDSKFKLNGYRLLIIGDGPDRRKLQLLIEKSDLTENIEILSSRETSLTIVGDAAFYVLSSRYEGLSNAMLEALALGVPVLATARHTSADEAVVDGVNGLLISETNMESIKNILDRAFDEIDYFSRQKIASETFAHYSKINAMEWYADIIKQDMLHPL